DDTGASAGVVDDADYVLWKAHFGESLGSGQGGAGSGSAIPAPSTGCAPEPGSYVLASIGLGAVILHRSRRARIARAIILAAALWSATDFTSQASTINFDSNAKSPAVIPFDPEASVEVRDAVVSGRLISNVKGPLVGGTNINALLGADAFYSHGFTGTNSVMANIEAGHIWSGHETLAHVQQLPNNPAALNEFDRHATWVGALMGGRPGG